MAEAPFSDEDSGPSDNFFNGGPADHKRDQYSVLNELVPYGEHFNGSTSNGDYSQQISESLDQLSTRQKKTLTPKHDSDSDFDDPYRKKARVGNHYQAKIPKILTEFRDSPADEDELLWNPESVESHNVEAFLKRIASLAKLYLPMGTHLRDNEEALFTLQKHNHEFDEAFGILRNNSSVTDAKKETWSEEECRNFESGLLNFGKNFFLIQKYKVNTRSVSQLVQFYYLWKKSERFDLIASRIRSGKKKYSLNPGISDLMCRYLGGQSRDFAVNSPDVQFIVTDTRKDIPQTNSQY